MGQGAMTGLAQIVTEKLECGQPPPIAAAPMTKEHMQDVIHGRFLTHWQRQASGLASPARSMAAE
jgi:hypothetical protein